MPSTSAGANALPLHLNARFDQSVLLDRNSVASAASSWSIRQPASNCSSLPALFNTKQTAHTQPRPPNEPPLRIPQHPSPRPPNHPPPRRSPNHHPQSSPGRRASNYPQHPPATAPACLSNLCRRPSPSTAVPFRRRVVVRSPNTDSQDASRPRIQTAARRASTCTRPAPSCQGQLRIRPFQPWVGSVVGNGVSRSHMNERPACNNPCSKADS